MVVVVVAVAVVGVVAEIHRQHQHQHSLGQMSCSSCNIKCEFVVGTSMNSNLYTNKKKHYTAIQKQNEIVVPWKFLLIHEKPLKLLLQGLPQFPVNDGFVREKIVTPY